MNNAVVQKILIIISIILFIGVTSVVYMAEDTKNTKRIIIRNQRLAINQQSTGIAQDVNNNIEFTQTNIQQRTFKARSQALKNQEIEYYTTQTVVGTKKTKNTEKSVTTNTATTTKKSSQSNSPLANGVIGNKYDSLNWNMWRSNFLNRILDDSNSIRGFDHYKPGTWFYFNFRVTREGRIENIIVLSFSLRERDKEAFEKMLKGYTYKKITKFPKKSKRKSVRVHSFFVLDNSERRSRPEDFYDGEYIKKNN